ncbi:MAG: hypothetical protein SOY31_05710, partial [Bacilli bacterium]|nr:hypothetical protein [Bacilli bacterium]
EGSYTYKINQEKSVDGSTTTTKVFKSMWPGSSISGLEDHQTYVGFFIGHLDGAASYLGLYGGNENVADASTSQNGFINVVGRTAKSTSCLIGKSRDDNPLDNSAKNKFNKLFDFSKVSDFNSKLTSKSINKSNISYPTSYDYNTNHDPLAKDSKDGNDTMATQNSRAISITDSLLDETNINSSEKTSNFLRIYPGFAVHEKSEASPTDNHITFNSGLGAGTFCKWEEKQQFISKYKNITGRNIFVDNGIWLWSTVNKMNDTIIQSLFGSSKEFMIQFRIKYTMNYINDDEIGQNQFQILVNGYNPERTGSYWGGTRTLPATNKVRWIDLSDYSSYYNCSNFPINELRDDSNNLIVQEQTISFIVDTSGPFANYASPFSTSDWNKSYYPSFCLGVGKKSSLTNDKNTTTNLTDNLSVVSEVGEIPNNTPYSFFSKFDCAPFELSIYELELTFTSKDGNVSNVVNHVDFLSTFSAADSSNNTAQKPSYDGTTWTDWDTDSRVRINFDVSSKLNETAAVFRFYRNYSWLTGYTVYGYYSNNAYPLNNTTGYSSATLANG